MAEKKARKNARKARYERPAFRKRERLSQVTEGGAIPVTEGLPPA